MNKYIRLSGFIVLSLFLIFSNTASSISVGGKGIHGIPSDLALDSLTVDGDLDLTGTATNHLKLPMNNDATTPTLCFDGGEGVCNTGFYESSDNNIAIATGGTGRFKFAGGAFSGFNANGPTISNAAATSTNSTIIPNRSDLDSGAGSAAADQPNVIAGGVEAQRWTEASREIEANTSVCVIATDNVTTTAAHALAVDDVVVFTDGTGDVCAPLVSGTKYFVETVTDANNVKVAATRGGSAIDITEDASGNAFTSTELEITVNIYGDLAVVKSITVARSPNPSVVFGDSDTTDSDDNAQIDVDCTDTGSNSEDCDMTFSHQIAGNMTAFMAADADGSLTITPDTIITGSATLNGAVTLGNANADAIQTRGVPAYTALDSSGTPQAGLSGGLKFFGYAISLTDDNEADSCTLGGTGTADCFILPIPTSGGRLVIYSATAHGEYTVSNVGVATSRGAAETNTAFHAGIADCANAIVCLFDDATTANALGIINQLGSTQTVQVLFWYD